MGVMPRVGSNPSHAMKLVDLLQNHTDKIWVISKVAKDKMLWEHGMGDGMGARYGRRYGSTVWEHGRGARYLIFQHNSNKFKNTGLKILLR